MAGNIDTKIVLRGVCKTFFTRNAAFEVLREISIEVRANEFLVLFGPGQCGKTVLLSIIAGMERPTSGEILIQGGDDGASSNVGVVFQRIALMPWQTVLENVGFGPRMRSVGKRQWQEQARHYIHLVGLDGFEDAYPQQLSGGMKQRVGIARAYCTDSDILLMDEPFGQLDAQTRYQMQNEILRMWEQERRTVIFVTNNIEEAVYLGDRIVVLSACPASVRRIYAPELPRPRDHMDEQFLGLRAAITADTDLAL
jgi:NitT/TauT family transport system ATP-binding protein/sulfonate transport system ATP-binding protein